MFGLSDMPSFFVALLIVLPLVALVHQLGHIFFAWLFGGKVSFILGRGRTLLKIGFLEIKTVYFIDSFCHYEDLAVDNKLTHSLVYAGGVIFNIVSVFILNSIILAGYLDPKMYFYQYAYFSVYYAFFAVLPIQYGENHPSDGKALYDVIKYGTRCDLID
ncbi:hypothetical protein GJU40_13230 [Bacillus lacus]|uniref:Peptidase M50 domain-containing protein n=1 Tax=Metabacillus lacus TaxID=1983721 RepID=A0A7X2J0H9_9BACI|nr:hypothetical protein [Metabacillus lacus]MRX73105.1 hypothetical protein [Metabacillus lacus]